MIVRVPPAVLVLATALADAYGLHRLGFYLLVAAVPAAAVAALGSFGDAVDSARHAVVPRLLAVLDALVLVCVLIAAAARGQTANESSVPPLGMSALVTCLALFAIQALVALTAWPSARRRPVGGAR